MRSIIGVFENSFAKGNITAACYAIYGPQTIFVYSIGKGLHEFVLENGEFVLKQESLEFPKPKYFCPGGKYSETNDIQKKVFKELQEMNLKIRFASAMIMDFHNCLHSGGMYMYPATATDSNGKLRVVYECVPVGWLAEQGKGKSSNGKKSMLELEIEDINAKTPFYVGSKELVELVERILEEIECLCQ